MKSTREQRIQTILHAYLQAVDRGETIDRQAILDDHPELKEELAEYFADASKLEALAKSLKTQSFGDGHSRTSPNLGKVRYFGDYELLEEIARGGMGVVFKARQVSLNRVVALKMILKGELATEEDVRRFKHEAEAAANLDHPNIVPIYEVGEHEGQQYFSMKMIDAVPGSEWQGKNKEGQRQVAGLLAKVARAVHHAHQRGILHRDLKPSNILIDKNGEPHVADFGLAKRIEGGVDATRSGAIVGTPAYMAPEQARAEKSLTTAVDVFSLGAILYEWLTGMPPFRGEDIVSTLMKVVSDDPARPRSINAKIDRDLETVCLKCLEKEPGNRYVSANALADDLERWQRGELIEARPVSAVERLRKWAYRRPAVAGLLTAVVILLTAGVIASWSLTGWALSEASAARKAEDEAKRREKAEADAKAHAKDEAQRAEREKTRAEKQLERAEWAVYAGKLLLAQAAFRDTNMPDAFRYLKECQGNRRGWEHDYLRSQFDSSQQTFNGHTDGLTSVCFSPDGTRILTGSGDNTAKLWDVVKRAELFTLKGHTGGVTGACFSPDGKRILTGSRDNTAKLWDAETGVPLLSLEGHQRPVECVCFSPDGGRIVTGSWDETAKVWDADKGVEQFTLKGHTKHVSSVCFSPDGKRILTGSMDHTAKVWDADNGVELLTLKGHTESVLGACFSPDGKRILTGSGGYGPDGRPIPGEAKVWDAGNSMVQFTLKGHASWVTGVAFSPDGKRVLTGSLDSTAKVWDADKGTVLFTLQGHANWVTGVSFSRDGKQILTGSWDKTAKLWNARGSAPSLVLRGHTKEVSSVCFSRDGKRILTGSWDSSAKLWDARTGVVLTTFEGHKEGVTSAAFSPNGKQILTGGCDLAVNMWDADTGRQLRVIKGNESTVTSVCFSPDGYRVLTGSRDKLAILWTSQTLAKIRTFRGHKDWLTSVCFSPDGKRILTGSDDHTAKLWDAATGSELFTLQGHTKTVTSVCFSRDGKRILTGSGDSTAKVWDTVTGNELLTLEGHSVPFPVTSVCFNHDGKRIFTGCNDSTAKVWDAVRGTELLTLKGHTGPVTSVAFSLDGGRVVTGSVDGTVRLWDARPVPIDR